MYRERKRNKIIIISLLVIVFIMAGAYSAFSSQLSVKSSSKVTSNWDIEITNVTDGVASGSAENASSPTWDALKASMEANLYSSGDSMEYDVTISNKGTLDAKLDDITTNLNNSNSDAVIITFSGYTKGEKLLVGESKVVHVKIAYNPSYTGDETSSEVEINFDYVQNNNETEPSSNTYLLTYDCTTNGGNSCSNNNEYLVKGSLANLSKTGTKKGNIFIGWNTDSTSTNKLDSYTMPESDSTLYAIYREENVTLTLSTTSTTNSITVVANATSETGISKYEYSIDGGTTWVTGDSNTYTFNKLNQGTSYNVLVKITSNSGKEIISDSLSVTTKTIETPTFSENSNNVVTITYPSECGSTLTCTYQKDNEDIVTVTSTTVSVTFTDSGSLVAKVSDGVNTVSSSYSVVIQPIMMAYNSSKAYWQSTYKSKISTVDIVTTKNVPDDAVESWDVSEAQNGSVMAYIIDDSSNDGMYKLYIGGNGGVIAPTNSSRLFYGYNSSFSKTTSINGLENLDTSNVTSMVTMFYYCSSLTSLDVSSFDTSNVTNMSYMFYRCSSFTSLDVSNFDTSKVKYMKWMFHYCKSLTSLDLSNFDTSNVTDMSYMFSDCSRLTSLDVSNFDTSNVTSMSGMFCGCSSLTSLDVSKFDTSNVTSMVTMFYYCSSLTSLDVSNFDTSNVTDMGNSIYYSNSGMFSGCSSLTSLDVSNFDTSNVTDMSYMFSGCSSLTSLDVSNFDTSKVTSMYGMFMNCKSLTSLDLSEFDTSKVQYMNSMFSGCSSLTSLNVSNFKTSNVTNMNSMFKKCNSLTSLDVSKFDTSNVTNMAGMFSGCSSLTSLDVSKFDTSKVQYMNSMFSGCSKLTSLDVSKFDTSNVTDMIYMFYECSSLTKLNLCNFDTSKVTSMNYMFYKDSKLTSITVGSNWTTANATTTNMFTNSGVSSVTTGQC